MFLMLMNSLDKSVLSRLQGVNSLETADRLCTVHGYSQTRWWSKWEVMNETLAIWRCGTISFDEFSYSTKAKLIEYFTNSQKML